MVVNVILQEELGDVAEQSHFRDREEISELNHFRAANAILLENNETSDRRRRIG